jgi:hypothetical protein
MEYEVYCQVGCDILRSEFNYMYHEVLLDIFSPSVISWHNVMPLRGPDIELKNQNVLWDHLFPILVLGLRPLEL